MGRHSASASSAPSPDAPGGRDAFGDHETGTSEPVPSRSPPAFRVRVAVAAAVALVGVVLLVFGLISLTNTTDPPGPISQATSPAAAPPAATSNDPGTPDPTTSSVPPSPAVLPVTVLNNSSVTGLASRVAAELEAGGWPIAELLNYDETQVPATTVFFTPGNTAEEAAAQAMIAQFPEISGGAEPRFAGLDGSGLTLAAVGDWVPEE